jgi:hypothetical protein
LENITWPISRPFPWKAPVLVKFLLNEKETLIHGLKPLTGCYYEWSKVKEFWANR